MKESYESLFNKVLKGNMCQVINENLELIRSEQGDKFIFDLVTCEKLSLGLLTKGLVLTLTNTNEVFKKMLEIY